MEGAGAGSPEAAWSAAELASLAARLRAHGHTDLGDEAQPEPTLSGVVADRIAAEEAVAFDAPTSHFAASAAHTLPPPPAEEAAYVTDDEGWAMCSASDACGLSAPMMHAQRIGGAAPMPPPMGAPPAMGAAPPMGALPPSTYGAPQFDDSVPPTAEPVPPPTADFPGAPPLPAAAVEPPSTPLPDHEAEPPAPVQPPPAPVQPPPEPEPSGAKGDAGDRDDSDLSLSGNGSPRRTGSGLFGGLSSMVGTALSRFSRSTQLDDFEAFVYNEKYKAWMPGNVDPDEWAKENISAPPPPPKASQPATPSTTAAPAEPNGAAMAAPDGVPPGSTPHTPLAAGNGGLPGGGGASSAAGGRFSARSGQAARKSARSRYVDTFNPDGGDTQADKDLMPPPPARPKQPPPLKVFTPQRPADAAGDAAGE